MKTLPVLAVIASARRAAPAKQMSVQVQNVHDNRDN